MRRDSTSKTTRTSAEKLFIFDCQAHVVRRTVSDGRFGMPDALSASQLINGMQAAGVDAALVSPVATPFDDYKALNEELIVAQADYPGRFYACPRLQPLRGAERTVAAIGELAARGARAFKLDPFRDSAYAVNDFRVVEPVFETLASTNATVIVDSSEIWVSGPGLVAEVARRFPTVSIVLGHSGGIWENHDEALSLARQCSNVYLETSRVWPPAFVAKAVAEIGQERVVFGSDSPPSAMRWELDKVMVYGGLSPDACADVVGRNLARLLGIFPAKHCEPAEGHGEARRKP